MYHIIYLIFYFVRLVKFSDSTKNNKKLKVRNKEDTNKNKNKRKNRKNESIEKIKSNSLYCDKEQELLQLMNKR